MNRSDRVSGDVFDCVRRALDGTGAPVVELWLRDDDAIAGSPALAAFVAQCNAGGAAPLFAVIPARLTASLIDDARGWPAAFAVAVHGIEHDNRAAADAKKSEFPDGLDRARTADDLTRAYTLLAAAFGAGPLGGLAALRSAAGEPVVGGRALPVFVPPWNRIGNAAAGLLAAVGYTGLSTFARAHATHPPKGIRVVNTHVDLIDWRGGRVGKTPETIARDLAAAIRAGAAPVGVLTHHLDHDAAAMRTLEALFAFAAAEPRLRWQTPVDVFARG